MKIAPELEARLIECGAVITPVKQSALISVANPKPIKSNKTRKPGDPKYNNQKVMVDGILFHSLKEGKRWLVLKVLWKAGKILSLRRQPRFRFKLNGVLIAIYRADFEYMLPSGERVVEDCKGFRTKEYRRTKRMMKAFFGIDILET